MSPKPNAKLTGHCLIPLDYSECPLGYRCDNTDWPKRGYQSWWNCENNQYCRAIAEPWYLPFYSSSSIYEGEHKIVRLFPPQMHSYRSYYTYMKRYGWAEAIGVRIGKINNCTLVVSNCFNAGIARPVPLKREKALDEIGCCIRDKNGVYWVLNDITYPPKDTEERWRKLAQKA